MATGKSNPDGNAEQATGAAQKTAKSRREQLLRKKEQMKQLKEFLQLKTKIHQLINSKKLDEAKHSYNQLYEVFQKISENSNEDEIVKFRGDLSTIYTQLYDTINEKKVKKGHDIKPVQRPKTSRERLIRKKIVTTDLDVIVKIVEEKGKINLAEIQSTFNINRRLAEEWIQILADYGLVSIKYLPVGGIEITKVQMRK